MIPRILIIAGSDSGGGAGIQADIKTVTMLGSYPMTAVTAVTAQNTLGVQAVHPVPTNIVIAQIDSCMADIGIDAIKIGMIGSAETADAVANRLATVAVPIVFDPVMVATSGAILADAATIAAFTRLMALATVTTPNLPEAQALGGPAAILRHGGHVLLKGGHREGDQIVDQLLSPDDGVKDWAAPRIASTSLHGTGCTLASALASYLGAGVSLPDAVGQAIRFVRLAIRSAPGLGKGHGPLGPQDLRLDAGPSMRLNQVSINGDDMRSTRDFYRALGLTLIVDSAANGYDYLRFEAPGGATLSIYKGGQGLYFECDDVDAEVVRLTDAGLAIERQPADQPWGWRQAWLRDPAGNPICLYTAGENRRYPRWRVES